jgi:pimeloyl-ACP methyl ester carboxylesterase
MQLTHGSDRGRGMLGAAVLGTALLGACAWLVHTKVRRAEAENPPHGKFVCVDGVRLHYAEHGSPDAPPLVILHGMGAWSLEIETSGLVEMAARDFHVIVFDRPGYGHSDRPSGRSYTAQAQAELFLGALARLNVRKPVVLGHSWGTLVARAMAQDHPAQLRAVVLAAGYYTPSLRLDTFFLSAPAIPVIGTLMRHTISPVLGRLLWPLFVRRIFGPAPTNPEFTEKYPVWMNLRPAQLRASAAESGALPFEAARLRAREHPPELPMVLVAGDKDRLVSTQWQSGRLHKRLPGTRLHRVPNAGHMVHHTAAGAVMGAIREAHALGAA